MRLAGKVAIISGAASGMGTATARMFAREGAKVVIADMLEHEGRQVAQTIGAAARFEPLDVTKEDDWAAVVAATTKHFGKLDVLVNNAGISGSAEQDFYSTEAWHRIMAVNATGVFFGIKYAVPPMIANGGGCHGVRNRCGARERGCRAARQRPGPFRRYGCDRQAHAAHHLAEFRGHNRSRHGRHRAGEPRVLKPLLAAFIHVASEMMFILNSARMLPRAAGSSYAVDAPIPSALAAR